MYSYQDLPGDTTVWIYQCSRELSSDEVRGIKSKSKRFLMDWGSHGTALKAAIELFYNFFIVIFVDEKSAKASGCSIDKSFKFVKDLESEYDLDLLDRMVIAYRKNGKIHSRRIDDFEKLISNGSVSGDTIVFNNLVNSKSDFDSKWEVLLKDSWHRRLL